MKPAKSSTTPWSLQFNEKKQSLELIHEPSQARISGAFSFTKEGKHGAWHLASGDGDSLLLMDAKGFRRGVVKPEIEGDTLRLNMMPRGSVRLTGALVFNGSAVLGKDSFACRTKPLVNERVVQMASGHADSLLNDSIFDMDRDIAIRFDSARTKISTARLTKGKPPVFAVQLTANLEGSLDSLFEFKAMTDYYRERFAPYYTPLTRKKCDEAPTGWMPWNVYFGRAGEVENLAEAKIGSKKLQPYGLKYWYIESWHVNGGFQAKKTHLLSLEVRDNFPSGMKVMAEHLRAMGFVPGLWVCPYGTGEKAFYEAHRDWFLHDAKGKPFDNWCGDYIIDPSNPAVLRYIEKILRVSADEWGYEFFKVDGTSANNTDYSSVFYERADVRAAFSRKCDNPMQVLTRNIRKGIGPDALLLWCCGDPAGPDVETGDAARIGADVVSRDHAPTWYNYTDQARMTLVHLLHNNIQWFNDPDTLLVGTYAPLETARLATTVVGLPGQTMIAGDKLAELPDERMWLLQRCLPVCPTRPLDLFPIHDLKAIWDLKVSRPFAQWDVLSVFNWDESKPTDVEVKFEEIGLDPAEQYLVFDFWNRKFLGVKKSGMSVSLAPHSNALFAVHKKLERPQFLSTDRHISQGGTSLREMKWDEKQNTLTGKVELVGGEKTAMYVYVPKDWTHLKTSAAGTSVESTMKTRNLLQVTLSSKNSRIAEWKVLFKK